MDGDTKNKKREFARFRAAFLFSRDGPQFFTLLSCSAFDAEYVPRYRRNFGERFHSIDVYNPLFEKVWSAPTSLSVQRRQPRTG